MNMSECGRSLNMDEYDLFVHRTLHDYGRSMHMDECGCYIHSSHHDCGLSMYSMSHVHDPSENICESGHQENISHASD